MSPGLFTLNQSDVELVSWPDGGICNTTVIDLVLDYAASQGQTWAGDTLSVIDNAFTTTGTIIAAEYKTTLESKIAEKCSQ